ncbi:MAG TPA: hypothetical protein DEA96_10175 [Leptospiraceae bacterium]|nr:hypothetical protein [Spirochaetaceae bacterium]HBS05323.1 hypothetical protein [Leptospiraceae bacterium]|tara:strand:+ start:386 stop:928 length:543 start_codon:yes stop_codon:yes gene_type:complete
MPRPLILAVCALAFAGACKPSPLKDLGKIESFALNDVDGNTREWNSFRGSPVLVFFGYTYCPDFCPMTLHKVEKAYKDSGSPGDWPKLIFISVDPNRDSPAALKSYLSRFSFPSVALTGSETDLRNAAKRFGVTFYQDPENPELMQHSPILFVIDEDASIRYLFKFSQTADELREIVDAL